MIKNIKKLAALAATGILLASCGTKSVTYTKDYTDGDEVTEAVLPVHTIGSAYAWNMMQMTKSAITVTITGEEYEYAVIDDGVTDKTSGMYFHREYSFKGAATKVSDTQYSLAKATSATMVNDYGSSFEEYESVWGAKGTFTQDDALCKTYFDSFVAVTMNVSGNTMTFALA